MPIAVPNVVYLNVIAAALGPLRCFAVGLGVSVDGPRTNLTASAALKLLVTQLIVYGAAGRHRPQADL